LSFGKQIHRLSRVNLHPPHLKFTHMAEGIVEMFQAIDPHVAVVTMSMLPIIELRGAIPVGLLSYNLPLLDTVLLSIIGNMIPVFFLLKYLEPVRDFFTSRIKWMQNLYDHIIEKTQKKHSKKFMTVGAIFLVSFVAIPVPGSGSWTGCLIAYLFNVPYWKALRLIFLGVLGAAVIVTGIALGLDAGISSILNAF